jgi:hypothetical protein
MFVGDIPERGYLRIEAIQVGHIQEWRYLRMDTSGWRY